MSYAISAWELSYEKKFNIRKRTIEYLIARFSQVTLLKQPEIYIRVLLPRDLGLQDWQTPPLVKGKHCQWFCNPISPVAAVCIYKVAQLRPGRAATSEITMQLGAAGNTRAIYSLDSTKAVIPILQKIDKYLTVPEQVANTMLGQHEEFLSRTFGKLEEIKMEAYFSEPCLYNPSDLVSVKLLPASDNKRGDLLVLGGFVAEPMQTTVI